MFRKRNRSEVFEDVMLRQRIIDSIKLLASEPEVQLSFFLDFVCKPYQIATSLSDWLVAYNKHPYYKKNPQFADSELELITKLNSMLGVFDDFDQFERTEDAVRTSKNWEEARKFSKHVLNILGVEYSLPDKRSV